MLIQVGDEKVFQNLVLEYVGKHPETREDKEGETADVSQKVGHAVQTSLTPASGQVHGEGKPGVHTLCSSTLDKGQTVFLLHREVGEQVASLQRHVNIVRHECLCHLEIISHLDGAAERYPNQFCFVHQSLINISCNGFEPSLVAQHCQISLLKPFSHLASFTVWTSRVTGLKLDDKLLARTSVEVSANCQVANINALKQGLDFEDLIFLVFNNRIEPFY